MSSTCGHQELMADRFQFALQLVVERINASQFGWSTNLHRSKLVPLKLAIKLSTGVENL